MEFDYENGIPIPRYNGKYPFHDMKVLDSVFFPGERTGKTTHSALKKYAKRHKKKFVARTYPEGLRIWRVA